jgi:hypothetical protein
LVLVLTLGRATNLAFGSGCGVSINYSRGWFCFRLAWGGLQTLSGDFLHAKIGAGCRNWCWVRGMALGAEDGIGQGGACFANFLMGRCSKLP